MKKKPNITKADLETFHQAVKGTKRINHEKVPLTPNATDRVQSSIEGRRGLGTARSASTGMYVPEIEDCTRISSDHREVTSSDHREVTSSDHPAPVTSEAQIAYHQPGIPHKTLRNLRKGQYNIEAVLDLHGMTVNEAKVAMNTFLQQCISDGIRVALVIHGKGRGNPQPILKNKLNQWLRDITAVLAFCSASAAHGSRGAIYILLKRAQGGK